MSAHVVIFGPSTAGKTSLMLGLTRIQGAPYDFTVERTWTTRERRPAEGDEENIFATPETFEQKRDDFLFTFQTFPTYEYGIEKSKPLEPKEIRLRILMPVFAIKFRELVEEPSVFCAITPYHNDPESIYRIREPNTDPNDLAARTRRFHQDRIEAEAAADVRFRNKEGLAAATAILGATLIQYIEKQRS